MNRSELFGALRERRFRLLWLGQATSTLGDGLVPATSGSERLQQANALLGLSRSLAFVVGPAVAGVIAATTNPGSVFVVDAATFAVSATSLALLRLPRSRREGERQSFLSDLKGGWHELISHTWLWVIVAWAATYLGIVV